MDPDLAELPPSGWAYNDVEPLRWQRLSAPSSWSAIVADVLKGIRVSDLRRSDGCDEIDGRASRVVFQLDAVDESTVRAMDRLLNGAYGLRARYALGPEAGQRASSAFGESLLSTFHAGDLLLPHESAAHILLLLDHTLRSRSAKVWFDARIDRAAADTSAGEISCKSWAASRTDPIQVGTLISQPGFFANEQFVAHRLAMGRTVPIPRALDIKAAFVRPDSGEEYVPRNKRTRSMQLHLMGWS